MLALQDTTFRTVRFGRLMPEKKLIFSGAFGFEFVLESYGVRVKIQASSRQLLISAEQTARKALLGKITILENSEAEHTFGIGGNGTDTLFLFQNGEQVTYDSSVPRFF